MQEDGEYTAKRHRSKLAVTLPRENKTDLRSLPAESARGLLDDS